MRQNRPKQSVARSQSEKGPLPFAESPPNIWWPDRNRKRGLIYDYYRLGYANIDQIHTNSLGHGYKQMKTNKFQQHYTNGSLMAGQISNGKDSTTKGDRI